MEFNLYKNNSFVTKITKLKKRRYQVTVSVDDEVYTFTDVVTKKSSGTLTFVVNVQNKPIFDVLVGLGAGMYTKSLLPVETVINTSVTTESFDEEDKMETEMENTTAVDDAAVETAVNSIMEDVANDPETANLSEEQMTNVRAVVEALMKSFTGTLGETIGKDEVMEMVKEAARVKPYVNAKLAEDKVSDDLPPVDTPKQEAAETAVKTDVEDKPVDESDNGWESYVFAGAMVAVGAIGAYAIYRGIQFLMNRSDA